MTEYSKKKLEELLKTSPAPEPPSDLLERLAADIPEDISVIANIVFVDQRGFTCGGDRVVGL